MEFKTLGCHGGETNKHRPPAFMIDGRAILDAGSITGMLSLEEQKQIELVLLSHTHLDHIRDLPLLADARFQTGGPPLVIASTKGTIKALKQHLFNNKLWPDFSTIPSREKPTIIFQTIRPDCTTKLNGFEVMPVMVDHTVEAAGFIISNGKSSIAYSGDTGPTERLWQVVKEHEGLSAMVMEVAFPNRRTQLAMRAGHHTPKLLEKGLRKLGSRSDLPILLFHIKPAFQSEVERDLLRIKNRNITILQLGDQFLL